MAERRSGSGGKAGGGARGRGGAQSGKRSAAKGSTGKPVRAGKGSAGRPSKGSAAKASKGSAGKRSPGTERGESRGRGQGKRTASGEGRPAAGGGPVRGSVTRAGERVLREEDEGRSDRTTRRSEPGRSRRAREARTTESTPAPLRVVRGTRQPPAGKGAVATSGKGARPTRKPTSTSRRPKGQRSRSGAVDAGRGRRTRSRGPQAVRDEILRLGGRRGERLHADVGRAAEAFSADRLKDAIRILRPVRDAIPESPTVRELLGLALYRSGQYRQAEDELRDYVALTGAVDQHPVLMDCARARRDYRRVDRLWAELSEVSPSAALVTEGRIVVAGARADQGRLADAIALLDRKAGGVKRAREHHLRLWYALADLEERAGNLPRARLLFDRVRTQEPGFADVAERLAALG